MNDFFRKYSPVTLAAMALLLPLESWGDMIIPSAGGQIRKAPIIVVGRFADTTGKIFIAEEVIKSPIELPEKIPVHRNPPHAGSDYDPTQFSMSKIGTEPTIFFAWWNVKEKALSPTFFTYSFWPQGRPYLAKKISEDLQEGRSDSAPRSDVSILRDHIVETIKNQSEINIWHEPLIIPPEGKQIPMEPFTTQGKSTYVLLGVKGAWQLAPSGKEVVMGDKKIKLWAEAILLGGEVRKYRTESIGQVGDKIELRFGKDLPRNEDMYLKLFASEDFPVKSVSLSTRDFK